jgi:DNA recombination-dependent growth factor C
MTIIYHPSCCSLHSCAIDWDESIAFIINTNTALQIHFIDVMHVIFDPEIVCDSILNR